MTLKRLSILRHHWLFITVLTALMVGAVAVLSYRQPAEFRAVALLQVQAPVDANGAISLQDTLTARERAVTIADLGNTGEVYRRAAPALNGILAAYSCNVSQVGQSEFVTVACTSTSKEAVAQIAGAHADALQGLLDDQRRARVAQLTQQYRAQLRELRAQGVPAQNYPVQPIFPSSRELTLIDPAATPRSAYAPRPLRNMVAALLLGLIVNSLLSFGLEYVQDRGRDLTDIQTVLGVPVLGEIPLLRGRLRRSRFRLAARGSLAEANPGPERGVA